MTKAHSPNSFVKINRYTSFGGRSLYNNEYSSASINAIGFVDCLQMTKEDFDYFIRPILDKMKKIHDQYSAFLQHV